MGRATLTAVNPVIPSRDVRASIEFYVAKLGFSLLGQDSATDPHYAVGHAGNTVGHARIRIL